MAFDITIKTLITLNDEAGDPDVALPAYKVEKTYSSKTIKQDIQTTLASATLVLWDPTNNTGQLPTTFALLVLWSDQDVEIELTINEGDANEELNSFRLAGGAPPFMLGADDAFYNHSASDAFAGSLDVIDKIRVKETNGNTAVIRGFLVA